MLEKVRGFLEKSYSIAVYSIILLMLTVISFNNIVAEKFSTSILHIGIIIIGIVFFVLLNKLIINKIKSKKVTNVLLGVGLAIFLILEIISLIFFKVKYNWDFKWLMETAEQIARDGKSEYLYYFVTYPHNLASLLLVTSAIKIFFGNVLGAYILNILGIFLSAVFAVLAARKIGGNKLALNTLIFLLICSPIYLYTPIVYTDTLSILFPTLTLYLWTLMKDNKENKKNWYILCIIITVVNVIAWCIKPTAAIIYVAIIIEMILSNKKMIKTLIISLLVFISVLKIYDFTTRKLILKEEAKNDIECPSMHYIMIGLNTPKEYGGTTFGWGTYSDEDLVYTMEQPDYESKVRVDKIRIKERLSNFGVKGYANFLWNKFKYVWNDGTYYVKSVIGWDTINTSSKLYDLVLVKYTKQSTDYINYFNAILMMLVFIGCIIDITKDKNEYVKIMEASLIAIALFLLIWEARSRYIYNIIPIVCILGANGVRQISQIDLKNKICKKKSFIKKVVKSEKSN